jgi:hypothetical protein
VRPSSNPSTTKIKQNKENSNTVETSTLKIAKRFNNTFFMSYKNEDSQAFSTTK